MKRLLSAAPILGMLLALGCASPAVVSPKDYSKLRAENPVSVLVVPVVNRSVDVTAPGYFLSTLSVPLAERGYYVFPAHLVKRVLEDDGLSDASLVHHADSRRLGDLFGADAVLYVTINKWDAKYAVLTTTVEVDFDYVLKSGRTGEELWRNHQAMAWQPEGSQSTGNLLADLVVIAVKAGMAKAAPNFMPLAHLANGKAFCSVHQGLPAGPHHEAHDKDRESF